MPNVPLDFALVERPATWDPPTWGASHTEKWPYGCEGIRSCRAVTNVSGAVPRVVETVETNKYQQKKFPSHQHTHTPHTRTPAHPYGYPHECRGLWFQIFNLRNSNLKLKLLTRRLRKNNSTLKKSKPTDRTNVTHQTKNCTTSFVAHKQTPGDTKEYACIGNFWTIVPRCDGAESGHSSGTSRPIASRDDGAISLTAAKNQQRIRAPGFPPHLAEFLLRTQDMILFQHRFRRDEQTERVCAAHASMIPIRRKAYFFNISKFFKLFRD